MGFLHWGLSSAVKSPSTHPQQVSVLTDRKANVKSKKILYGVKLQQQTKAAVVVQI